MRFFSLLTSLQRADEQATIERGGGGGRPQGWGQQWDKKVPNESWCSYPCPYISASKVKTLHLAILHHLPLSTEAKCHSSDNNKGPLWTAMWLPQIFSRSKQYWNLNPVWLPQQHKSTWMHNGKHFWRGPKIWKMSFITGLKINSGISCDGTSARRNVFVVDFAMPSVHLVPYRVP